MNADAFDGDSTTVAVMGWLAFEDELPCRPSRVLIAGTSGSGKSTLARRVAAVLDLPYVELDALHHATGWTARAEFLDDVQELCAQELWTTEWQYPEARSLLAARADLFVFLDLPRPLVMARVVRRTLSRRLRHTNLWGGNVEPPLHTIFRDPEHIVRWAWRTHAQNARRVADLAEQQPELPIVRLTSPGEIQRWVAGRLTDAGAKRP